VWCKNVGVDFFRFVTEKRTDRKAVAIRCVALHMQSNGEEKQSDHSFPGKNYVNSAQHFDKFCVSSRQITLSFAVNSQVKESQFCFSKYSIYCYSSVTPRALAHTADKAIEQSTAVINY